MSAGDSGWPKPMTTGGAAGAEAAADGVWASLTLPALSSPTTIATATPRRRVARPAGVNWLHRSSRIDVLHAAIGLHAPGLHRVVVVERVNGIAPLPFTAPWLCTTMLVGGAAHQVVLAAVTLPGQREARKGPVQYRAVQLRRSPGATSVHGHIHTRYAPPARPGQTSYFAKPMGLRQTLLAGGVRDHRLHLHVEREALDPSIGQHLRVQTRLVLGVSGRVGHFEPVQPFHVD